MRHYRLIPVCLAADGLQWLPCGEHKRERYAIEYQNTAEITLARQTGTQAAYHWWADVSPHERATAQEWVTYLNAKE